jgi:hypothetical protein
MNRLIRNVSMLVLAAGLLPVGARAWAQAPGQGPVTAPAAAAQAEMQTDVLSGFKREEMEDRRQEIVVANMKFSNDEQKTKFLALYVPYQEKLMNNLKQRKKLLDDYQNAQQNGVIGDAEATKLLNANLTLDRNRVMAESTYLHSLKAIMPMEQALRAYQIDERLNAFYLNDMLGTIHLAK